VGKEGGKIIVLRPDVGEAKVRLGASNRLEEAVQGPSSEVKKAQKGKAEKDEKAARCTYDQCRGSRSAHVGRNLLSEPRGRGKRATAELREKNRKQNETLFAITNLERESTTRSLLRAERKRK